MTLAGGRKTIFITGAASGIGAATAQLFARRGWFTILADIDRESLSAVAAGIGAQNSLSTVFDVREPQGWAEAMQATAAATGGTLDLLFNNAGIARSGAFETIPQHEADRVVDVNLKGVIHGVYAALPLLLATRNGRIINVSSVAGLVGAPGLAVYSATKWAVRGLTEALDAELRERGVRVVSLMPWFMDTPILDKAVPGGANRSGREALEDAGIALYPVEMAAERAWAAAFGEEMHYTVGKLARRASFGMRFFPKATRAALRRSMRPRGQT